MKTMASLFFAALLCVALLSGSTAAHAQDSKLLAPKPTIKQPGLAANAQDTKLLNPKEDIEFFDAKEMMMKWENFAQDKGWQAILKDAKARGFKLGKDAKKMWGAQGKAVIPDDDGTISAKDKKVPVIFCVFDLEKNEKGESCSMLWSKQGDKWYKAYIVIPKGKGIEDGQEWYVDEKNNVQEAHSWRKCFFKKMPKICGPFCGGAIAPCALAGGATVTAAGIGAIASPAVFLGCMAAACGGCVTIVAIACAAP